ncbi:MAG: RNA polymerase sporulation sigma factor SigK [Hyphomonadaceae bacterium]|nr:RNA polymerase sporulation sigma factor SigK [Clostridia bacterium]
MWSYFLGFGFFSAFWAIPAYITNFNAFPQPLCVEDERLYLMQYKEGDREARDILIERNLRLVAHIAKKYTSTGKDADDLISIGTIGLIKSIETFNADKGVRLATYAARCIENEVLMILRAEKKQLNEISLHEPIGVDKEGNSVSLMDKLSNEGESVLEKVEEKIQLKKIFTKIKNILRGREKVVVEMRYGLVNGCVKTQREIADLLGISRSYVSRIEKKAITKLGKELNDEM